MLVDQTADRPTHLAKIIRREPTHMWLCDDSVIGAGGVWLYLSRSGKDIVWRHSWLADIISDLVSPTNREGKITNFDLELAALVLQEATLLAAVPDARLSAPSSKLDNIPTVSWSTKEVSTINPAVADLLGFRALHLRQFSLNPSIFITRNRFL